MPTGNKGMINQHSNRYGKHTQYAPSKDITPLLTPAEIGVLQSIVGSLLFYVRAVDPSMLPGLNEVST